jgi:hypothetical protein
VRVDSVYDLVSRSDWLIKLAPFKLNFNPVVNSLFLGYGLLIVMSDEWMVESFIRASTARLVPVLLLYTTYCYVQTVLNFTKIV